MSQIGAHVTKLVDLRPWPMLKALGFSRKGKTFHRIEGDGIQVINVQSSMSNQGQDGKFTVNLGVYFPALEGLWQGEASSKPVHYACHVRERIGSLFPSKRDHWWSVGFLTNLADVSADVAFAMSKHGLPWLDAHSTIPAAAACMEPTVYMPMPVRAGLLVLAGRQADAERVMVESMRGAPQTWEYWRKRASQMNMLPAYDAAYRNLTAPA
jgi:hypothetical protein